MSLSFLFFFNSPTEDDVYVIDFLLLLSLPCFRCSALSRTESRLDQCIVFLFQLHSSELETRKVMQVRFGRGGSRAELLEAPQGQYMS